MNGRSLSKQRSVEADPIMNLDRSLRVATVGTGYFSRFQYDAWRRLPGADIVALCNRSPGPAEAFAEEFGVPRTFEDVGAMLDAVEPDLLDIITPPVTHREAIRAAADRGVAIICQKPFCTTLAEATAAVALTEAAGVPLIVHENFRFQPWYREIAKLLRDGAVGAPYQIAFRLRPGDGQGPRAYLDRQPYFQKMPRFLVHETAIHFIDTFRFLFGEISAAYASLKRLNPVIQGEDAGRILLDFANGTTGIFDGNRLADHAAENRRLTMGEMTVEGADGTLRLDGDGRLFLRRHGSNDDVEHSYEWPNVGFGGDCVGALQAHAIAHLREGAPAENTGRAYLRNLEIEEAVYMSAETGQRISL